MGRPRTRRVVGSPHSAAIEKACDGILSGMMDTENKEPWSTLSEKIISALPDNVKQPILEKLEAHNPDNMFDYQKDIERADPSDEPKVSSDDDLGFGHSYDMESD